MKSLLQFALFRLQNSNSYRNREKIHIKNQTIDCLLCLIESDTAISPKVKLSAPCVSHSSLRLIRLSIIFDGFFSS
jgi:hypothetical protein